MRKRSAHAAVTWRPQLTVVRLVRAQPGPQPALWRDHPAAKAGPRRAAAGRELVQLLAQETGHDVEVRHQLTAGDQPEVQVAAIAHHRDVEPLAVDQGRHRVVRQHLGAGVVERHVRAGNVGDEEVERVHPLHQPQLGGQSPGLVGQGRHRELGDVGKQTGRDRAVLVLGRAHGLVHGLQSLTRVGQVGRQGASIIDTLLPRVPFWSVVRTETGTAATSGAVGRAWCSSSQRRSAPAHNAMTTSLTVRSLPARRLLTSASGRSVKAHLRCADSGALNGVPGACSPAVGSRSSLSLPGRRCASEGPMALASPGIERARSATTRTACSG